eukprot:4475980-Alexandrium_andersonii.AAC.1
MFHDRRPPESSGELHEAMTLLQHYRALPNTAREKRSTRANAGFEAVSNCDLRIAKRCRDAKLTPPDSES